MSVLPDSAWNDRGRIPSGTVSFAFTDIEGSTQRWDVDREAMQIAVRRHDALVRAAIVEHAGYIFKTLGDAFCAAFWRPEDAVAAMVAAQAALAATDFSAVNGICIRAAVHLGTADERDGDYFGPVVNRVARLLSIGHGGQLLVSGVTAQLVQNSLPPDTRLSDLGRHRLRDLTAPEHVFEIVAGGRTQQFPPLRSVDAHPNNLPTALTTFVGREHEIGELTALVTAHRVVTLVGTGGVGKTRTSLQVAANFVDHVDDGVWLIEFAPLTSGDYVAATVAQAVGLTLAAGGDSVDQLVALLAAKEMLLIFDNCEHLVDAAARLAAAIVRGCPLVKIFASSRQALGIAGEQTYRLPTLTVPNIADLQALTAYAAGQSAAVALFVDRARAVDKRFTLTDANAGTVSEICGRLDGIALAIELAAARVRILTPRQLRDRLDERFRVLTGGSRDVLPRQQTLRALIDWSYDLLDERERTVFRRLSIFVNGFTLEAAVAVAGDDDLDEFDVIDVLTSLVDKSLVLAEAAGPSARYSMLESTRAYALERLSTAADSATLGPRHAAFFSAFAHDERLELNEADRLAAIEADVDNVRAALTWLLHERHDIVAGAGLALALGRFWSSRLPREGHRWFALAQSALAAGSDIVLTARIATAVAGMLPHGSFERFDATQRALDAAREAGLPNILVRALSAHAEQLMQLGRVADAQVAFEEALEQARLADDNFSLGRALAGLGMLAIDRADIVAARELSTRAITCFEAIHASDGVAYACSTLSEAEYLAGNLELAIVFAKRSRAGFAEASNIRSGACAANNLAVLFVICEQPAAARDAARDALEMLRYDRHPMYVSYALEILAHVATLNGDTERGSLLYGYTRMALSKLAHDRSRPAQWCFEQHVVMLTRALGTEEFERRAAAGGRLAEDSAYAVALAV